MGLYNRNEALKTWYVLYVRDRFVRPVGLITFRYSFLKDITVLLYQFQNNLGKSFFIRDILQKFVKFLGLYRYFDRK